jgi:hypothetical protein
MAIEMERKKAAEINFQNEKKFDMEETKNKI